MKKLLAILLALVFALALVACDGEPAETDPPATDPVTEPATDPATEPATDPVEEAKAMTYAEYIAAPLESEVLVEAYVQAHQSWWDNKITVYLADQDGAYFAYEMACSEEDAAKLTPGTKIRIKGYKAEWSGEVEITDCSFTFVEGADTYIAPAVDVTALLGTDQLIEKQNQLASFFGMTVVKIEYKNNEPGDDIYVTLSKDGAEYSFCVERYLTGPETEVYAAVGTLVAGDVVDVEGFVYWYNGLNTHITSVKKVTAISPVRTANNDAELADILANLVGVETIQLAAGEFKAFNYVSLGTRVDIIGAVDENGAPATTIINTETVTDASAPGYWDSYAGTVKNIIFTAPDEVANNLAYEGAWGAMRVANGSDVLFENCQFINQGLKFSGVVWFKDVVFDGKDHVSRAFHYCCPTGNINLENVTIKGYVGDSFHLGEAAPDVVATLKNVSVAGPGMAFGNLKGVVFEDCALDCQVSVYLADTVVSFANCTLGASFALPQKADFTISDLGGNTLNGEAYTVVYSDPVE